MRSMTAFAEAVLPLEAGQLRLTLRSVNHKALDLSLRLPPALFPLEAAIRAKVRETAQRGKLHIHRRRGGRCIRRPTFFNRQPRACRRIIFQFICRRDDCDKQ